jgi:hypothetical protein
VHRGLGADGTWKPPSSQECCSAGTIFSSVGAEKARHEMSRFLTIFCVIAQLLLTNRTRAVEAKSRSMRYGDADLIYFLLLPGYQRHRYLS